MAPPDFGRDLSGKDDLDPMMSEVEGFDLMREAVHRRITTPRGQLLDSPDYGLDVFEFLSTEVTPAELAQLPGQVAAEVQKDQRIQSADATLDNAGDLSVSVTTAAGPFSMTLLLESVTTLTLKGDS